MPRDIKLYEFNSLNDNEKHEAMMEYAILVGDRFEGPNSILLYQFDNFYVELFYNRDDNQIQKFRSFQTQEPLTPYLNQIDLNELK